MCCRSAAEGIPQSYYHLGAGGLARRRRKAAETIPVEVTAKDTTGAGDSVHRSFSVSWRKIAGARRRCRARIFTRAFHDAGRHAEIVS